MKRIHLLIVRSFTGPFFLIFFIVLFVLLMQFLWRYIDELVGKGLEFNVIAQFLMYTSFTLVPMALPLSILMSSLMTFGNLGEQYELTAMKASGISLQRIMMPLIIITLFISLGAFFFANRVLPYAQQQMRSLLYDIRQLRPEISLQPGEFVSMIDDYSIRIQSKNPKTNMLYSVQIYDHTAKKGNSSIILADSGLLKMTDDKKELFLTLYNGYSYNELQDVNVTERKRSYPHRYDEFDEQQIIIQLSDNTLARSDLNLFKGHYAMMDLKQLEQSRDSLQTEINVKQDEICKALTIGTIFKKRDTKTPVVERKKIDYSNDSTILKTNQLIRKKGAFIAQKRIDSINNRPNTALPDTFTKQDAVEKDSSGLLVQKPILRYVDIDSIFNLLTLKDRSRVVSAALTYSRSSKNIIENSVQSLEFKISYLRRIEIEWHRKFTIAFSCLVFLFIGAPLGAIIRKGGLGLPLVLSVIFFIFYYILSLIGDKLVRESLVPSYQGMWYTPGLFFITGIFLTYKAASDSSILNIDTYLNFVKKIFGQRYNVVDKISINVEQLPENKAKLDNIYGSLTNLEEAIDIRISVINENLRFTEFLASLFALQSDSNLILFERYYNNTFRVIINHPVFHKKNIRAKIHEFPSFNYKDFQDENGKLILKVIAACTIILTPLVAIRHYLQQILLRAKLKKIKELLPELLTMIKLYELEY